MFQPSLCALVERHLSLHLHSNALFLAERLFAANPNEVHRHLLACCLIYSNEKARAVIVLRDSTAPTNRYLLARYCFELDRHVEAEAALLKASGLDGQPMSELRKRVLQDASIIPNAAAGLHLLGQVYKASARRDDAVELFKLALQLDPFMWCSFEELCTLGADPDPGMYFHAANAAAAGLLVPSDLEAVQTAGAGAGTPQTRGGQHDALSVSMSLSEAPTVSPFTPVIRFHVQSSPAPVPPSPAVTGPSSTSAGAAGACTPAVAASAAPAVAPPPVIRQRAATAPALDGTASASTSAAASASGASAAAPPVAPPSRVSTRRSSLHGAADTPSASRGAASGGDMAAPVKGRATARDDGHAGAPLKVQRCQTEEEDAGRGDPGRGGVEPKGNTDLAEIAARRREGIQAVLQLLHVCGTALRHLSMYRCQEAIETLKMLPESQFETGWVLAQCGRAYLEMAQYRKARSMFERMRSVAPDRLQGLDYYSTALWHLREEAALSFLAQEAVELDKRAPQTWIVVGNCFSLQKDHESALQFLKRAIQVDPRCTYAYTLCGHELVASKDPEQAASYFRQTIQCDDRHYNAWFGLGCIYKEQQKTTLAEYHFRRALALNPRNPVLHNHLAKVLLERGAHDEALRALEIATQLEPNNTQAQFLRANVLVAMERYQDALDVLEELRDRVPGEAEIHVFLGRVCKSLKRYSEAVRYLNTALDLGPKDTNQVKALLEKLYTDQVEEDQGL